MKVIWCCIIRETLVGSTKFALFSRRLPFFVMAERSPGPTRQQVLQARVAARQPGGNRNLRGGQAGIVSAPPLQDPFKKLHLVTFLQDHVLTPAADPGSARAWKWAEFLVKNDLWLDELEILVNINAHPAAHGNMPADMVVPPEEVFGPLVTGETSRPSIYGRDDPEEIVIDGPWPDAPTEAELQTFVEALTVQFAPAVGAAFSHLVL